MIINAHMRKNLLELILLDIRKKGKKGITLQVWFEGLRVLEVEGFSGCGS